MTEHSWAELVTRGVRARLPEVRAARRGLTIVWTRGAAVATIAPAAPGLWELMIVANGRLVCRTYPERTDVDTSHVAAGNIISYFDIRRCRGTEQLTFDDAEMKRTTRAARPLQSEPGNR